MKQFLLFMFFALLCVGCVNSPIPAQPVAVQSVALPPASLVPAPSPSSVGAITVRTGIPAVPASERVRSVLVVRDASGFGSPMALSSLRDWLQSAFSAGRFAVVIPEDAIETLPESAVLRLAENLGAKILLDASVTDARVRHVDGTDPGEQAVLDFSVFAKAVPSGEILAGSGAVEARGKKVSTVLAFARNAANNWSELAKEAAFSAARALDTAYAVAQPQPTVPTEYVKVVFQANISGANVRIDGVSHGTVGTEPRIFSETPGLHVVEVSYPGLIGFKDTAKFQEGTTFGIMLALTAEGNAARKRDALFDSILTRLEKSGATDDLVREIVAKGYAKYLETSHTQLEGMPQTLTVGGSLPSLGLNPVAPERPVEILPPGELLQKASDLAQ